MKKKALYALACVLYLTGCSTPEADEIPEVQNLYPVQFCMQLEKETLFFPAVRSMPDNPIPEPTVSKADGADKELSDLCSRIEYAVFTNEETPVLVKHRQYTTSDLDFGIVYDSLPKGNYTFCFLAHMSEVATLSGTILAFDKVSDSFYSKLEANIEWAEVVNEDITLERIISQIQFKATDTVPGQIKKVDMAISGWPDRLNLFTGKGVINTIEQNLSHLFTPEEIGKEGMTHSFYTYLPPDGEKITVRLSATGKNDELIRTRNIRNITPEANKVIRYSGRLYSLSESDNTFEITILNNGEWGVPVEEELPEVEPTL